MRVLPIRVLLCAGAVLLASASAYGAQRVAVSFGEAANQDEATLRTVKTLTESELAQTGFEVVTETGLPLQKASAKELATAADTHHLDRIFELSVLPMGRKLIVILSEREARGQRVAHSARLTASGIEEMDVLVPRLVKAVVGRVSVQETAEIESVTDNEGRRFRKKAGEFLWGISLLIGTPLSDRANALYGGALRCAFEMPRIRLDVDASALGSEDSGVGEVAIRANYLFLTGNISPFVGGGMGLLTLGQHRYGERSGAVGSLTFGLELFRLYRTRLIGEFAVSFPFFNLKPVDPVSGSVSSGAGTIWHPIGAFKLSLLW